MDSIKHYKLKGYIKLSELQFLIYFKKCCFKFFEIFSTQYLGHDLLLIKIFVVGPQWVQEI